MNKLLFYIFLVATQLSFASEQTNQSITSEQSTDARGQSIITYTYHDPSSMISRSIVCLHADGSHTTHNFNRFGSACDPIFHPAIRPNPTTEQFTANNNVIEVDSRNSSRASSPMSTASDNESENGSRNNNCRHPQE